MRSQAIVGELNGFGAQLDRVVSTTRLIQDGLVLAFSIQELLVLGTSILRETDNIQAVTAAQTGQSVKTSLPWLSPPTDTFFVSAASAMHVLRARIWACILPRLIPKRKRNVPTIASRIKRVFGWVVFMLNCILPLPHSVHVRPFGAMTTADTGRRLR